MQLEHWLYTIPLRLRSLFRRADVERELEEEMQFHLERRIEMEVAAGTPAEEARHTALRAMEGMEQQKEVCRDVRRMNLPDDLLRNLRYAIRAVKRNPGFAAVTVVTLALGIGANTAIFSLVNAVMLRLLPVKAPEQLYLVGHDRQRQGVSWNYPDYQAMRDHNNVFTGLAAYNLGLEPFGVETDAVAQSGPELSYGIFVSGNYFDVLGVTPALGRLFNTADDRAPGAAPYVVLSYRYWHSHFSGDSRVIGRKLRVDGYPLTVIGVAPAGFAGADVAYTPNIFVPIMMRSELLHMPYANWNNRQYWWMAVIGRLKPGIRVEQAEAELFGICKQQEDAERRTLINPRWATTAEPVYLASAAHGFSFYGDELKKPLRILFAVVAILLVIACANVANLMLARGATRQREIAVRLALGASRRRVVSQLLTESMLIAALGAIGGVLVALAGTGVLLQFMPEAGPQPVTGINGALDWRVFLFTAAMCVLTGLFFGIGPALRSTRPDLVPSLKDDVPGASGTRRFTVRKGLVILQVGLSLPLLVGAGLLARTLGNLRLLDAGFDADNVFIASVDPTRFGYKGQRTRTFYDQLCARVAALPGVRAASLALITPLTGASANNSIEVEGYPVPAGERDQAWFDFVGPRYFEALGTPMLAGSDFKEQDNPAVAVEMPERIVPGMHLPDPPGPHVAIVNESFARHYFRDRNPLGMHVKTNGPMGSSFEIVGVAKDARYFNLRSAAPPMVFLPVWRTIADQRQLVIRTDRPATLLAAEVRREIHQLDPAIPLLNLRPMDHDVDQNILTERLLATLSGFFSILALGLCAVGLYGVVAYTVTSRTREIGIRMALGAARNSVLWLVFGDVISMIAAGALIGTVAAFLATRAIAGTLYGVGVADPLNLIGAGLCLLIAAWLAAVIPARRASKVDPMVALRYE